MKLFFSGFGKRGVDLDPRIPRGMRYRLLSCHDSYLTVAHAVSMDIQATGQPHELMYDSGAFTAWNQGKHVELDDLMRVYDNMLERYAEKAHAIWFISLDVIPGARGRTATPSEIEEACRVSDVNFGILRKRYGERVLPVFHQNESTARLHEVASMAEYICVSPRNDVPNDSRVSWAKEVHALIPGKLTHGLATTGYYMMRTVPWASVDSARYVRMAMSGGVFRNVALQMLLISEHSSYAKQHDKHFYTLPTAQQKVFRDEVERRGFTIEGLRTDLFERLVFNRLMMTEAQYTIPDAPAVAKETAVQTPLFAL